MKLKESKHAEAMERYRLLMLEIKERTLSIGHVLDGRTNLHGPLAKEFCFLQLRLICECIALSCLVAHGEIEHIKQPKFQKQYAADALIKELEKLHPDFYPHPVRFDIQPDGIHHLSEMNDDFLTKTDLIRLVGTCGDKLHRGQIRKYTFSPTEEELKKDFQSIDEWGKKILRLVEQHKVNLFTGNEYILCLFRGDNGPVEVYWAGPGGGSQAMS